MDLGYCGTRRALQLRALRAPMSDEEREEAQDALKERVDTVPPPEGEDDAYNAPTRVGKLPDELLDAMKDILAEAAGDETPPAARAEAPSGAPAAAAPSGAAPAAAPSGAPPAAAPSGAPPAAPSSAPPAAAPSGALSATEGAGARPGHKPPPTESGSLGVAVVALGVLAALAMSLIVAC